MKKLFIMFFASIAVFALVTQPVLAEGDKERGDKGEGSVCQYQNVVIGDPVFDGEGCDE